MRSFLILLAMLAMPAVHAGSPVPGPLQGRWVPLRASCESPVAAIVEVDKLTLVHRSDREALSDLELAGPGYFPPNYQGIMQVVIAEFNGNQPATMIFNPRERRGVAQLEFARRQPGGGAQLNAYNTRIAQLNLARRFPLHNVPLKRC